MGIIKQILISLRIANVNKLVNNHIILFLNGWVFLAVFFVSISGSSQKVEDYA
jgi:hypothetical protein